MNQFTDLSVAKEKPVPVEEQQPVSPAPLITRTKSGELPTFNKPKPLPRLKNPKPVEEVTKQKEQTSKPKRKGDEGM